MALEASTRTLLRQYWRFVRDFFHDLFDDRLGYYAASLSWNTLFSIIPILVILLSIFTYLPIFQEFYKTIHDLILSNLMPTDSKVILYHIDTFIANAGKLGMVGAFYVLFAAVMFFKNYDYIVNDTFHTPTRRFFQALRTYAGLILAVPLLLGASFFLSALIQGYLNHTEATRWINLYYFLPYLIVWLMFYLTYQFSANKRISRRAALTSSFIASLIWQLTKSGFVYYIIHNQTYASVYGGISIVLFFFLWIYISWAIFLHGLRFCYLLDKEIE
jgi:membrane protein